MSKHETVIAIVDDKLEKLQEELRDARGKKSLAVGALERAEKEVQLIEYSLNQLQESRDALVNDRTLDKKAAVPGPTAGTGRFA